MNLLDQGKEMAVFTAILFDEFHDLRNDCYQHSKSF
jgi:hypothetical protein